MLCEICHEKEACVKIVYAVNNEKKTLHVCEDCAKKYQNGAFPAEEISKAVMGFLTRLFQSDAAKRKMNQVDEELDETLYTEPFLKVLRSAKEEAEKLSANAVGTEHLLLGLLTVEEGMAYEVLRANGIQKDSILELIQKFLASNYTVIEYSGHTYTPMCVKLFRDALSESKKNGETLCGTEYLLLSILNNTNCSAARLLNTLSVSLNKIREDIQSVIETGKMPNRSANGKTKRNRPKNTPNLDQYSRDLTALAEDGTLDPVIGRDEEIGRLIQTLSRRTKNNPCLIGEPGVGKTAVVEGLAERIVEGNVPDIMMGKRIVSLDLTSMVAGSKYRGEFEERIKNVINEVANDRSVILFIDEIHTIIGAGGAEGALDAANIIKPALSRGELQLIGATTVNEYRKHIEKDAALERRFQPVTVEEPSEEESIEILKGLRPRYEAHHKVKISDEAIRQCVQLSKRYLQDRFLPDKAIDLMDEASSKLRLSTFKKPSEIEKYKKKLDELDAKREEAVLSEDFERAKKLGTQRKRTETLLRKAEEARKADTEENVPTVTEEEIQDIISTWTKIPVTTLKESDASRLKSLENTLRKRIVSQDEAVTALAKAVRRGRVGLKDPKRPIGSFLFLGPTGVGKTELTKALSEAVFGSEKALIRVDMSEYMEKHSVSKLVGSPPGYVGFEEGGQLSEKVRRNPYSVLLFDEIEKAHPDVFNILLQVLDDGIITDSQGRRVDFKNTIIIMTSNLGAETIFEAKKLGFGAKADAQADYNRMRERVLDVVKRTFKPEFINRIDEMIVFHPLDKENLAAIVEIMLSEVSERVLSSLCMKPVFSDEAKAFLIEKGYDSKFGARPLRRAIQTYVEDGLSESILDGQFTEGDTILVDADKDNLTFRKK